MGMGPFLCNPSACVCVVCVCARHNPTNKSGKLLAAPPHTHALASKSKAHSHVLYLLNESQHPQVLICYRPNDRAEESDAARE
eukprot:scaffold163535_cov21-Tisochrysis_lutea.AAC.3